MRLNTDAPYWLNVDLPKELQQVTLVGLGDMHVSNPRFDRKQFLNLRNWILSQEHVYVVHGGDDLDFVLDNFPGDPHEEADVDEALYDARDLLFPLASAGRILVSLDSNHMRRSRKKGGLRPARILAELLKVPYAGDGAFVRLAFGADRHGDREIFGIYATHGWGGGRRAGGLANKLEELGWNFVADVVLMFHMHKPMAFPKPIFVPDYRSRKLVQMDRMFVTYPGFLKWGGYAEAAGLGPTSYRTPYITLTARPRELKVTL